MKLLKEELNLWKTITNDEKQYLLQAITGYRKKLSTKSNRNIIGDASINNNFSLLNIKTVV